MRNYACRLGIPLILSCLAVVVPLHSALALSCPSPAFTLADGMRVQGATLVLVTHATTKFDSRRTTERGLEATIRFANQNTVPFIYLQDKGENATNYFYPSCNPAHWYDSGSGDFGFTFDATHVISLGGFSEACHSWTVRDISTVWSQPRFVDKNLRLSLVSDGIYSFDLLWVDQSDPFFAEYKKWKASLPNEESVISVQEIRDFIRYTSSDAATWEAIVLKRWFGLTLEDLPKTHQILFAVDGKFLEVIREGPSQEAPILTIDFVKSELLRM